MGQDEPLLGNGHHGHKLTKKLSIVFGICGLVIVGLLAVIIWQAHRNSTLRKQLNDSIPPQYTWITEDIESKMDKSVDPCSDFYSYVCGTYASQTVLEPGENMRIAVFEGVDATNAQILLELATGQWPLIGDLYTSCMADPDIVDGYSAQGIMDFMQPIIDLSSTADVLPLLATLHATGVDAFFVPQVMNDLHVDKSLNYLVFQMSGLTISDPTWYTVNHTNSLAVFINQTLAGYFDVPAEELIARSQAVAQLESQIASITPLYFTIQDEINSMVVQSLQQLITDSGLDYKSYITNLGLNMSVTDGVIVSAAPFFAQANLTNIISTTALQTVQDYLVYKTMYAFFYSLDYTLFPIPQSAKDFISTHVKGKASFAKKQRSGFINHNNNFALEDVSPQQMNCIVAVDSLLSDFVGLLFSTKVLDQSIISAVRDVTDGVQGAFRNSLNDLKWLDAASRANTTTKLDNIIQIIGHPNKLDRYRGVILEPTDFFSNMILLTQLEFTQNLLVVNTPFNRSDYEFPATIVNAFYSPFTNTINFPAGILESPMFSVDFPKMLQYARMGYVIGHETTHGFDNTGSLFDSYGAFFPIMDEKSAVNYNAGAQCIVNQFDSYEALPGYYVNGEQTLGENIADLGGVKNSFRGYKAWVAANKPEFLDGQVVKGLTADQLFFVMFGQTWCTAANAEGIIDQLENDVHSPSKFRVNGPLSNFDEFAKAFKCKGSSKMVNSPQCVLW